jgi:hypothetical protein
MNLKTYPIMDKYTPTYDLDSFKKSSFLITTTALQSAAELGFTRADIQTVVSSMEKHHFYKSMTSKYNHGLWQDVYHVPTEQYLLYIKFTADNSICEFKMLSFKQK